jgi:glucan phosphoethanolaminetransferase (alkaline phosphatase superfamily)
MDTIGTFSYNSSLILTPIVFAYTIWRFRGLHFVRRILSSILFSVAAFVGLQIAAWSILFRDGMGPGMVPSHGLEAFENCWAGIAIGFVVGAVLFTLGILLARPSKKTVN